ncbi:hypothetical protein TYRP_007108 [Tyrophagus putrescentiae]|nr:hypothetical protein TYRP_007108 [Tyrophagus putrescentiae]
MSISIEVQVQAGLRSFCLVTKSGSQVLDRSRSADEFCLCLWQSRLPAPSVVVELLCPAEGGRGTLLNRCSRGTPHKRWQSRHSTQSTAAKALCTEESSRSIAPIEGKGFLSR